MRTGKDFFSNSYTNSVTANLSSTLNHQRPSVEKKREWGRRNELRRRSDDPGHSPLEQRRHALLLRDDRKSVEETFVVRLPGTGFRLQARLDDVRGGL